MDYRYIAAGKRSSTKMLSKILSSILTLVDKTLKYSDSFKFKFKNTAGYWIVKNKNAALSTLNYLNDVTSAKSIRSFDFKKLYTNLPHDKVIEKISILLKRCFDEKKVEFINVSSNFNATWSTKSKGKWSFSIDQVVEMFIFLMNNFMYNFKVRYTGKS